MKNGVYFDEFSEDSLLIRRPDGTWEIYFAYLWCNTLSNNMFDFRAKSGQYTLIWEIE